MLADYLQHPGPSYTRQPTSVLYITSDGDDFLHVFIFTNKYLQLGGSSEILSAIQIYLKIVATIMEERPT